MHWVNWIEECEWESQKRLLGDIIESEFIFIGTNTLDLNFLGQFLLLQKVKDLLPEHVFGATSADGDVLIELHLHTEFFFENRLVVFCKFTQRDSSSQTDGFDFQFGSRVDGRFPNKSNNLVFVLGLLWTFVGFSLGVVSSLFSWCNKCSERPLPIMEVSLQQKYIQREFHFVSPFVCWRLLRVWE